MQISIQHMPKTYRAKFLHTEIFKDLIKASTFNDSSQWELLIPIKQDLYDRVSCVSVNDEVRHSDLQIEVAELDPLDPIHVYRTHALVCGVCDEQVEWEL